MNLSKSYLNADTKPNGDFVMDIVLTLLLLMITSAYIFGYRTIVLTFICVVIAAASEYALNHILKNKSFTYDTRTLIYATITAFFMPAGVSLLIPVLAGVVLVLVKWCFESKDGYYFTNPVIVTVAVLECTLFVFMDRLTPPFAKLELVSAHASSIKEVAPTFINKLLGAYSGGLGTTSIVIVVVCGAYLVWRKIISWQSTVMCIAVCSAVGALLWHGYSGLFVNCMVFAAVYGMWDFSADNRDFKSKLLYGGICGLVISLIAFLTGFRGAASVGILAVDAVIFLWYKFYPLVSAKLKKQ